jgi:hypothetical protein
MGQTDNLKQWKKGQSGNPSGRPRKIFNVLKEKGYTTDDIKSVFREVMWYDEKEMRDLALDKTKPMIMRITANQVGLALSKGDMRRLTEILEQVIGRPKQAIDIADVSSVHDMSKDQVEEELLKRGYIKDGK